MSAICGLFYRNNQPFEARTLAQMSQNLSHRGIDGSSQWHKDQIGFAIQKFNITSESKYEVLPFYDSALKLTIVGDIWIDNRDELFAQLNIPRSDHKMPDSLLVLRAYTKWGKACVDKLKGKYVIALWNAKNQELVFITDRMGMNSVYYYSDDNIFAFASEIKALHALPQISHQPNLKKIALLDILGDEEIYLQTFFDKIFILPTASIITITAKNYHAKKYWQPDINKYIKLAKEEDYIEEANALFTQAINACLRTADPIAVLLSGGIDSSAIACEVSHILQQSGESFRAFTAISSSENCIDERDYKDCLLKLPNIEMVNILAADAGPLSNLTQLISVAQTPACTSRHFLYSAFAECAKQGGERILLDGCYGELGPSCYGKGYLAELFLRGKYGLVIDEIRARAKIEKRSILSIFKSEVLQPLLPASWFKSAFNIRQMHERSMVRPEFITEQLGKAYEWYLKQSNALGEIKPNHRYNQWHHQKFICDFPKMPPVFVGHEYVQIMSPFADPDLLAYCLAIPGNMKVHHGYQRYLIRAMMPDVIPDKIRYRTTKEPFSPDYSERYNRQRLQILHWLENLSLSELSQKIIDIDKLTAGLKTTMKNSRCETATDFSLLYSIPKAIYLLVFLEIFFK